MASLVKAFAAKSDDQRWISSIYMVEAEDSLVKFSSGLYVYAMVWAHKHMKTQK